ncbi:hypothetical protein C8J56DRAFT_1110262 [Mycena floridula]|nr:hypothetical protein C8J56DRAFT_1110262 [Mycena floridula]
MTSTSTETSFAIIGKGYDIVASDTTSARSIVKMKVDEDKIKVLSHRLSGKPGDTVQFAEFIERNIRLYQIRNNYALSPSPLHPGIVDPLRNLFGLANHTISVLEFMTALHRPHTSTGWITLGP